MTPAYMVKSPFTWPLDTVCMCDTQNRALDAWTSSVCTHTHTHLPTLPGIEWTNVREKISDVVVLSGALCSEMILHTRQGDYYTYMGTVV